MEDTAVRAAIDEPADDRRRATHAPASVGFPDFFTFLQIDGEDLAGIRSNERLAIPDGWRAIDALAGVELPRQLQRGLHYTRFNPCALGHATLHWPIFARARLVQQLGR